MLIAIDKDKNRIFANKNVEAFCPGCNRLLIAKCGDLKTHHFSHYPYQGNCLYDFHDSFWAMELKRQFPLNVVEVYVKNTIIPIFIKHLNMGIFLIDKSHSMKSVIDIINVNRSLKINNVFIYNSQEDLENDLIDLSLFSKCEISFNCFGFPYSCPAKIGEIMIRSKFKKLLNLLPYFYQNDYYRIFIDLKDKFFIFYQSISFNRYQGFFVQRDTFLFLLSKSCYEVPFFSPRGFLENQRILDTFGGIPSIS